MNMLARTEAQEEGKPFCRVYRIKNRFRIEVEAEAVAEYDLWVIVWCLGGKGNRGFGGLGKIVLTGVLLKINEEDCEVKRIASKTL